MANLLVTVTCNRPKAFEQLKKVVKKQTTNDFHWLIVCDGGWDKYVFPKDATVIKRDNSADTRHSICENWLAAIGWIQEHEYDKFIIIEDDDYYHPQYVLQTIQLLDNGDLVGWFNDAYYYVLSRKPRLVHNQNLATLAATAFNRKALGHVERCAAYGNKSIDLLLWHDNPPDGFPRFTGKKILADNFTGLVATGPEFRYETDGHLTLITNQPELDDKGNLKDAYPRHVGMKEPWHGGELGATNHSPQQGGGIDLAKGLKLKEWIGEDNARFYLSFTRDIPTNPYPPNTLVAMGVAE